MINDLSVSNFRGVSSMKIDGLRAFTVLTGANNCGKTTLLEAAALCAGAMAHEDFQGLFEAVATHRGVRGDARANLFPSRESKAQIASGSNRFEVSDWGIDAVTPHQNAIAHFNFNGGEAQRTFYRGKSVCFVAAETSRDHGGIEAEMNFAEKAGHRRGVMEMLRLVDPTILDLRILLGEREEPILHAVSERSGAEVVWPVALAGSGFKRLLTLLCRISDATGLICVDDPDAHMHPRLFKHVAEVLWQLVEKGAQVIIATHNVDLISAIAEPINGPPLAQKLGVYGLARDNAGAVTCTIRQKGAAAQLPRSRDDLKQLLGF